MKTTILALAALTASQMAGAQSLDDCIISGMKGVSSDVAARMVRQACENKVKTAERQRLENRYGRHSPHPIPSASFQVKPDGLLVAVSNPTDQTAVLVSLELRRIDANGACEQYPDAAYVYRTTLKPGAEGNLLVPDPTFERNGKLCSSAWVARTRAPRWSDVQLTQVSPLTPAELQSINSELPANYGRIDRPAPSTSRSPLALDANEFRALADKAIRSGTEK